MATDYNVLEEELTKEKAKLERELHMHNVRRLHGKQDFLAKEVTQRKQIEILEKQIADLQPRVSTVYCPQHVLKDHEINGYLVYLLNMRDFFRRDIATKQEKIDQLDFKIKMKYREICAITREQAKEIKNKLNQPREYIRLENMSNKMEQMNRRISTLRGENGKIMENISKMRKFQKQFKIFEIEFRRKIDNFKNRGQELLDKAVSFYEEKDEFLAKQRVFKTRRSQDLRKTAIHDHVLNLCLRRGEKNEEFAELQAKTKEDKRIAEASDMIEQRLTGLEPSIHKMAKLQTTISEAAGEDTPEKIEESFRTASDSIDESFSYLDELFKDINRLQGEINSLKKSYNKQKKSINLTDTKFCRDIERNEENAEMTLEAANEASKEEADAKAGLNSSFDFVKSLYATFCPEDSPSLEQIPIVETNVMDYLQKMEKQLLDYLIYHEYIIMKAASKKTKPTILETDNDQDIEDEVHEVKHEDILPAAESLSETDLQEGEYENFFLEFEQLKDLALAPMDETEDETSEDEIDEYF